MYFSNLKKYQMNLMSPQTLNFLMFLLILNFQHFLIVQMNLKILLNQKTRKILTNHPFLMFPSYLMNHLYLKFLQIH